MNIVNRFHGNLEKYKNRHTGETCYIFGCGPTINNFKQPNEPGIYIGCNRVIKNKEIRDKLKYYFFGHKYAIDPINEDGTNNKKDVDNLSYDIEKFCFVSFCNNWHHTYGYSETDIAKLKDINAIPCDLTTEIIYTDISKYPFINHSVVYPATQFALYCGFTKIYLVGCDCATQINGIYNEFWNGNYTHKSSIHNEDHLIEWWLKIKEFKDINYPNAKLVNINPVGLINKLDGDIFI
jgi:hypothetical protein